jgi:hypothetical protein
MKIVLRIFTYPFVLGLILTVAVRDSLLWLRYGGEVWLNKKGDRETISDIYQELKKQKGGKHE